MIKKKLRSALFLKTEAGLSLGKIFLSEILPKIVQELSRGRIFFFLRFLSKSGGRYWSKPKYFCPPRDFWYMFFYDFLRLPLKRVSRIYSARRRPVKKYVCQAQNRRMFKRYWRCVIRTKYIYYLSRRTLKSTYWIFVNKHLQQWINLKI